MSLGSLLLVISVLLLLSVLASKASARLGVPALVLFLLIGTFAGSEGPGGIKFDDPRLAQYVGVVALIFIVFAGGFDTDWASVRPVLWQGVALSTVGVCATTLVVAGLAIYVIHFSCWKAVTRLYRLMHRCSRCVRGPPLGKCWLEGRLKPLLELESGSNDPMAVFLTSGFVSLLSNKDASLIDLVPMFALQMPMGLLSGWAMGKASALIINRSQLDYDGLYPVLSLSLALSLFLMLFARPLSVFLTLAFTRMSLNEKYLSPGEDCVERFPLSLGLSPSLQGLLKQR
jgi:cell volume regulation protein A